MKISILMTICRILLFFTMTVGANEMLSFVTDSIKNYNFSFWEYGALFWSMCYLLFWTIGDIFACLANYLSIFCYPKIEMEVRMYFFNQLQKSSAKFMLYQSPAYLITHIDNVAEGLQDIMEEIIEWFIPGIIFIIYAVIYFSTVHLYLSLFTVLWIIAHVSIYLLLSRKSMHYSKKNADQSSIRSAIFANQIANINTIKMFGVKQEQYNIAHNAQLQESRYYGQYLYYDTIASSAVSFIAFLFQAAVFYYILIEEMKITKSVGYIIKIIGINFWVLYTVYNISEKIPTIVQKLGQVIQSFNVLKTIKFENTGGPIILPELNGNISIKNLTFELNHIKLFKNFSMEIKSGDQILITGMSGLGKSTLFNILTKIHEVNDDQVFINNIDINQLETRSLREKMGYISQNNSLFDTTIRENITLGKHFTDHEIVEAAKNAEIHDFICHLPNGYHTRVSASAPELSGGQIQRINIARTILHHNKQSSQLLLCDEITSSLDNNTRIKIINNIKNLYKGHTILWIDHRVDFAPIMDKVVTVDNNGQFVVSTHDELILNNKYYKELFLNID